MKEICRVHFPDLMLIDDSNNGQGQQKLDGRKRTTNRWDWNLARKIIDKKLDGRKVPSNHLDQGEQI
jgi:hypothetical protein